MSGYVPRHSRPAGDSGGEPEKKSVSEVLGAAEPAGREPQSVEDLLEKFKPAEASTAKSTDETPASDSSTELSSHDEPAGALTLPAVAEGDEELLETILDADKAVRENPELANPLLANGEIQDLEGEASLVKIRKRRWPVTIAIILAAIIIAGAVTYYVLSSQALEREANRTHGYDMLNEAIALIQESDTLVVSLDSATVTEVTEANLQERKVLLERVPSTLETLDTAEDYARSAVDFLTSQDDKDFAQHVINSAVNRKDLLTSGETIISKDIEAMNSALIFGQAWELIINADTELRQTTELSKTGAYWDIQEAINRNNTVITNLQQASGLITQAGEAFPEADYSTVSEYLVLKIESVQLAIEADQLLLGGDAEAYNAKNTEFGMKDAAVVEAAGRIPASPLSLITDAYDASTADDRALYDAARAKAAEADGYIREYVGVETQTAVQ